MFVSVTKLKLLLILSKHWLSSRQIEFKCNMERMCDRNTAKYYLSDSQLKGSFKHKCLCPLRHFDGFKLPVRKIQWNLVLKPLEYDIEWSSAKSKTRPVAKSSTTSAALAISSRRCKLVLFLTAETMIWDLLWFSSTKCSSYSFIPKSIKLHFDNNGTGVSSSI